MRAALRNRSDKEDKDRLYRKVKDTSAGIVKRTKKKGEKKVTHCSKCGQPALGFALI